MFPLIIFPAICKEKGCPFGDPQVCTKSAMSYASLSMAMGAIYIWSYVYNIVRILSMKTKVFNNTDSTNTVKSTNETTKLLQGNRTQTTLLSTDYTMENDYEMPMSCPRSLSTAKST